MNKFLVWDAETGESGIFAADQDDMAISLFQFSTGSALEQIQVEQLA